MTNPITPNELTEMQRKLMPEEVIKAWNEMIAEAYDGTSADILLGDARTRIRNVCGVYQIPYKENYLNIEDIYREAGWNVEFNKPDYTESYESFYEFSK